MKKFKLFISILLVTMCLQCVCFAFSGCDPTLKGTIYSLEEVYAAQEIDRDNLLNIAYHNGDQERNKTEMENFDPVSIGELSEDISLKIRECVAESYRNDGTEPETTAENIFIEKYLGCYNGYYAVRFTNNLSIRPTVITDPEDYIQEVDGVEFCYWQTSIIHLWKENKEGK